MLDATAPPFDPVDLEPSLRPFGQSRMLPRDAYVSPRVFAFEQEQFFAGSWTCVGREGDLEGTGAQRAVKVGRAGVLLARGADGKVRAFANTCRHRGHELLGVGEQTTRRTVLCPYHAWTYDLDGSPAGRARVPRAHRLPPGRARAGRAAAGELARVPVRQRLRRRPAVRRARRGPRRPGRALPAGAAGPAGQPRLRAGLQLEGHPRELPRVLPLPADPPRAVPGQPAGQRRQLRAGRRLGRRHHGPQGPRGHHVAGRPQRRRPHPGAGRRAAADRRLPRAVPQPPAQPAPRLRDDPPDGAAGRRTGATSSAPGTSRPRRPSSPASTPAYAVDFWDRTNRQDWAACESVQRGMASPHFQPGPLAPAEDAVYHVVTMIARAYLGERPSALPLDTGTALTQEPSPVR